MGDACGALDGQHSVLRTHHFDQDGRKTGRAYTRPSRVIGADARDTPLADATLCITMACAYETGGATRVFCCDLVPYEDGVTPLP